MVTILFFNISQQEIWIFLNFDFWYFWELKDYMNKADQLTFALSIS